MGLIGRYLDWLQEGVPTGGYLLKRLFGRPDSVAMYRPHFLVP